MQIKFQPSGSQCRGLGIPSLHGFGPDCLGAVGVAPSALAAVVFLLSFACSPLWRRRPIWLRGFATESDFAEQHGDGVAAAKSRSWTVWTQALLAALLVGLASSVAGFVAFRNMVDAVPVLPLALSVVFLVVVRPRSTPGSVFIVIMSLLLDEAVVLAVQPDIFFGWPGVPRGLTICSNLASWVVLLNMPLRDCRLDKAGIAKPFSPPTSALRSPEDDLTLWQWLSVSWMAPLITLGIKRQINDEDVWLLPFEFQHKRLHTLFRDVKGSVFGRLVAVNCPDLLIVTGLGVLETVAELSQVLLMKKLLGALGQEPPDQRAALLWALCILFVQLVKTQSGVFSLWFGRRTYERSRGELITMLYEKTIRRKAFTFPNTSLPDKAPAVPENGSSSSSSTLAGEGDEGNGDANTAKAKRTRFDLLTSCFRPRTKKDKAGTGPGEDANGPASTGKILNLMRSDAYEVSQRFWEFASITTKPLSFVLSLVLIWRMLGASSLIGMLILVAGQVINAFLLRALLRIERARRAVTDSKLQQTSQFVEAIRHLRWYDWQDAWLDRILDTRRAELGKRVLVNIGVKVISTVNQFTAYLFPVAGFLAYTKISGRPLTVDVAFPALDLFGLVQTGLRDLPGLITVLLNARIAMSRIEKFMVEPDKEQGQDVVRGPAEELEMSIKGASFSWPGCEAKVLQHVSLLCRPGLTVVCGRVGIGKTALLHGMLGELDQHGGECVVPREMIGYTTQTPWLQSMSIRENILFCAEYDEVRYRQVLDSCCLLPDLANFKAGDLSNMGENGVGLSGGQRARVALARAIYSRSRILLLDDPIAALDHQTAETILRKLFAKKDGGLMEGRLVVFVTHRVDLVTRYADQVLDVVDGGHVKTFNRDELENNQELRHLAATAVSHHDEHEEEVSSHQDSEAIPDKFIEEEHRARGGVMASVYWRYIRAGSLEWWAFMLTSFALFRVAKLLYFWFLARWGEAYAAGPADLSAWSLHYDLTGQGSQPGGHKLPPLRPLGSQDSSWLHFDLPLAPPQEDVNPWIFWFFVLSMAQVVTTMLADFSLVVIVYKAGKRLFQDAMRRVTNATFRFYDITPVGRLMNRLTSDMGTVDGQIAAQITEVGWYLMGWISSVVVIASATPLFLLVTFAMTGLFVVIFGRFLPASQSLRRLEMVSLSPFMSNVGTLIEGLTTIRAFRAESVFQDRNIVVVDAFQNKDHFYWSLQSWLQYRFDALSAVSTFTLTATALGTGLSSGTVAFVLASATNFVASTHALCRKYGELQMQFVSVERIVELLGLPQEPRGDVKPAAAWPGYADDIILDNVTLRYAPEMEPSLSNVSLRIPAGSSVAVTGRTGSGKSTLALSLLGTLPVDDDGGSIRIGAIDLARVDKRTLRRAVSFVAQDPVLFPGTLRDNLDPLGELEDVDCAGVLARVLGSDPKYTLDSRVDAGGKNLSQGQRQLVGLGRAILRRSPVVILDEATASIDKKTAGEIQAVLRDELRQSTVITIAHRVEAVRDANFEIVLDKGRVVRSGPVERTVQSEQTRV